MTPISSQTPDLKVLIVEDDPNVRLGCEQAIQLAGIPVDGVASAEAAIPVIGQDFPGILITDMRLPGMNGLELLKKVVLNDPALPVIMITGHGDVSLAVEAMRAGAYDFIPKPFSPEHLVEVVRRALEKRSLTLEVESLRRRLAHRDAIEARLIGRSPQIEKVRRLLLDVANTAVDVLILGETGSGKEMVARCLHDLSSRHAANYVALNCGGLPDNLIDSELFGHEAGAFTGAQKRRIGKIEHANGGTLFLDEVESMPMAVQIKLLRVLQERVIERLGSNQLIPVACRVVAATKENLKDLSDKQRFRADLYYRLNVVTIDLPALRDRREDIPLLLEHFMLHAAQQHGRPLPEVSREQLQQLMAHDWPGNVRELRNAAECLVLGLRRDFGKGSTAEPRELSLAEAVEDFERSLIAAELRRQNGNLARSSEALRIPKTTLHDKIRKYGLQA
ncbi:MAG TPA: sigma-54 dependent transcriptional regulator [Aromatoleum sp.]|uniref:sigma-54-dependent transcriptional regulator n=1 Tax=Aromatoleum sp. TaxID=2307007 RepID=UPI002B47EEA2|nr:sigma-54 dependent transcriptional regulator [Aromatoleum sp.]HJV28269.1 sigma-54 dependent transcriptional regulator [Aromatoleum sp.]